jgi:acetate kinase
MSKSADKKSKFILSINAGSSSVKLSLYTTTFSSTPEPLIASSITGLTSPPASFTYTHLSSESSSNVNKQELKDATNQESAFQHFLNHMSSDSLLSGLKSSNDIDLVCHRIVHGGDFDKAMVLSKETIQEIEALTELAPLFAPPSLSSISTNLGTDTTPPLYP